MQSIKLVVRRIGVPDAGLNVYSAEETSEYIAYQYSSQGYVLSDTHNLGEVKNQQGSVQGWSVMFVLVKDEELAKAKVK